jgi:ribosome-binding ATPase YchF (GTP1/OBG family)
LAKAVNRAVLQGQCITIFRGAVRSSHTLDPCERRLVGFLIGIGKTCDEFVELARTSPSTAEKMIVDFVLKEKQRAEQRDIVNSTINNTLKPVKLLLEMNDVGGLNWKKINNFCRNYKGDNQEVKKWCAEWEKELLLSMARGITKGESFYDSNGNRKRFHANSDWWYKRS